MNIDTLCMKADDLTVDLLEVIPTLEKFAGESGDLITAAKELASLSSAASRATQLLLLQHQVGLKNDKILKLQNETS